MTGIAIVGSGNIGTDLMIKVLRSNGPLEMVAMVGVDADSDGLKRASRMGVATTSGGVDALLKMPEFADVQMVFDATSAAAHKRNWALLEGTGRRVIDLTPAAIGPYVVPVVNLDQHLSGQNFNMVTCGGQATIPIVAAVAAVAPVVYGEIVSSIASKSAGPGTRANIDEFTETTSQAVCMVGGAQQGKAVIVLNPAEPPLLMRNTVFCLVEDADQDAIERSIIEMVGKVQSYVPGYRLKQQVQFDAFSADGDHGGGGLVFRGTGTKVSVYLEVEGAAHYLPSYAGNLDIMTSAALRTGERLAAVSTAELV